MFSGKARREIAGIEEKQIKLFDVFYRTFFTFPVKPCKSFPFANTLA